MSRSLLLLVVVGLAGCTSSSAPEPSPAPAPEVEEPAPAPAPAWKILAPSPLELQAEVAAAGVTGLEALVPSEMPEISTDDKDRAAMQTGVLGAYTVLGGTKTDEATFIGQVRAMRNGLETLGTGQALLDSIDRFVVQIENDAAARQDFLKELDAQVQMSVPEEGWGPDDTTGPLLQAGAWLAGIHLVSRKVVEMDDAAAADTLLRRGDVAKFFLDYIQGEEGATKAGGISQAVAGALTELRAVAERESIGTAGAKEIAEITGKLLELM